MNRRMRLNRLAQRLPHQPSSNASRPTVDELNLPLEVRRAVVDALKKWDAQHDDPHQRPSLADLDLTDDVRQQVVAAMRAARREAP